MMTDLQHIGEKSPDPAESHPLYVAPFFARFFNEPKYQMQHLSIIQDAGDGCMKQDWPSTIAYADAASERGQE